MGFFGPSTFATSRVVGFGVEETVTKSEILVAVGGAAVEIFPDNTRDHGSIFAEVVPITGIIDTMAASVADGGQSISVVHATLTASDTLAASVADGGQSISG